MFMGMQARAPSRRHLRHWERVCVYLDAQPYRAVRHPLALSGDVPLITTRLLRRLATHGLVRHKEDCRWQLSLRWRTILTRLWDGAPAEGEEEEGRAAGEERDDEAEGPPFVADRGVDTLYVSLFADALPGGLIGACDALKARAQEEDDTVETPWVVLGAPLSMYKSGVGTSGKGRGVSWSYILRNAQVMLLLRRAPLAGLVGSARLSAEALWTHGARGALDGLRADLAALWGGAGRFAAVRWQLAQIHLCADVARLVLAPEDLDRLVARSRKVALHAPSADELGRAWDAGLGGTDAPDSVDAALAVSAMGESWALPPEWVGVPLDLLEAGEEDTAQNEDDDEEAPADELGVSVHLWSRRVSGLAFSPGGELSAVLYDKLLEERLSGKRWMEPIHRAGGWRPGMPLTRVEARFRRGVLRNLLPLGNRGEGRGAPASSSRWFDDPWTCLAHLDDLWAHFAGLPPEADAAPDVTARGWLRLALSDPDDGNRSRWPTDPAWHIVQRAGFGGAVASPLTRVPSVSHDLNLVDAELYGLLKLRAALRGEYLEETATLSLELRNFAGRMEEVDAEKGRDFAEEVREKARHMGKPVPLREIGPLPRSFGDSHGKGGRMP